MSQPASHHMVQFSCAVAVRRGRVALMLPRGPCTSCVLLSPFSVLSLLHDRQRFSFAVATNNLKKKNILYTNIHVGKITKPFFLKKEKEGYRLASRSVEGQIRQAGKKTKIGPMGPRQQARHCNVGYAFTGLTLWGVGEGASVCG